MAARTQAQLREVIARVRAEAAANPTLKAALSRNHVKVLSQPPHNLTAEELSTVHEIHPELQPADDRWGAG